jgi:uncharacterized membrane protein
MKIKIILVSLIILVSMGLLAGVCAASIYSIEFNQTGGKLIVTQNISGNYSTYTDSGNLEKTSSGYAFIHKITFDNNYSAVFIRLNLDEGYVISNQDVYPSNYELETDGQKISLVWNIENVTARDNFAMFVVIKGINSNIIGVMVLVIIILAILIAIAWLYYYNYIKSGSKKEAKFERHLLESEKRVIEELKNNEKKELWQKELQIKTGFSKAKLSRVIRDLESRGLIRKIPLGNTNKVVLK